MRTAKPSRATVTQRRLAVACALVIAAALTAAPSAGAAVLMTDNRCYQETQDVVVTGQGFRPTTLVTISRGGSSIGTATTDASGAFVGKFGSESLTAPAKEALFDLAATDGTNTAITRYRVTKVFADFFPGRGNPSTLRVRFTVNGFGLLRRRSPVYLHYVRPNGAHARTVRLGVARGTCGKIRRTAERRLFGFRPERGRWILQFDTNATYRRATQRSRFIWVRKPVEVFRRG